MTDRCPRPSRTCTSPGARSRVLARKATTVICMATMLHTIATGNITPSYHVDDDGTVRPVYIYAVRRL